MYILYIWYVKKNVTTAQRFRCISYILHLIFQVPFWKIWEIAAGLSFCYEIFKKKTLLPTLFWSHLVTVTNYVAKFKKKLIKLLEIIHIIFTVYFKRLIDGKFLMKSRNNVCYEFCSGNHKFVVCTTTWGIIKHSA
jgi:hypothetical protein